MNNEYLMEIRLEVIANYPNSPFEIGEIIYNAYRNGNKVSIQHLTDMSHLFRQLKWFEKREKKEMPKFLLVDGIAKEVKEYGWFKGGDSAMFTDNTTEYLSHCEPTMINMF